MIHGTDIVVIQQDEILKIINLFTDQTTEPQQLCYNTEIDSWK